MLEPAKERTALLTAVNEGHKKSVRRTTSDSRDCAKATQSRSELLKHNGNKLQHRNDAAMQERDVTQPVDDAMKKQRDNPGKATLVVDVANDADVCSKKKSAQKSKEMEPRLLAELRKEVDGFTSIGHQASPEESKSEISETKDRSVNKRSLGPNSSDKTLNP